MITNFKPKKTDDREYDGLMDDYAPKKYSFREHVAMGGKLVLVIGFVFGLMWLLNAIAAK